MVKGGYRIVAAMWCDNMFGCNPDTTDALIDFNNSVNLSTK